MKRFYKFLMPLVAIVALALPWSARAQDTLTVANGTTTNSYIPVYGFWADAAQHNQFVYPASMLEDMIGSAISSMTLYMSSTASSAWGTTVTIKMTEIGDSTLSGLNSAGSTGQVVWTGVMNGNTTQCAITFDAPYVYLGSNLLVDITTTAATYSSASWYGVSHSNSSYCTYSSSTSPQDFIPKTTFTYASAGNICMPPTNLTVSDIQSTGFTVSWNSSSSASTYVVRCDSTEYTTTDTFYVFNGLDLNTVYTVEVAGLCTSGDTSVWRNISARTLAGDPISTFPYTCGFEIDDNDVNEAAVWVLENNAPNGWYVGTTVHNTGTKGLYISNSNGTNNSYTISTACVSYAYATFQLDPGEYTFSFDWKSGGESSWDFLRAAVAPFGTATPNGSWTSSSVASGFTTVDGGYMNLQPTWQTKQGTFTITTAGVYNFYFVWRNDGTSGDGTGAAIDNFSLSINTCPAPVALTIDSLMPTQIDIHWSPLGTESEWAVEVGDTLFTGISDTFYTVTNLEQYTQYTMRVYAVCDDGDTSFASASVTGRTTVSCPWPTGLHAAYVTSDTITVEWTPGGDESEWLVVLNNGTPVTANDSTFTFDGLTPNTQYTIKVRAVCGADDTSAWTTMTVRTACGKLSDLPYTTSFENDPYYTSTTYANAFPYCWTRINDASGSTNYYPYIYANSTYAHTGNNGMYWYLSTTASYANNEYAVLPELDTTVYPVNNLELMFYAKTTATTAPFPQFIVGVMTENDNDSTFTPYDTITLTSAWTEYTVDFSDYTGYGSYIAIRCPRTTTSRYAALDDVTLRVPNPCSMPTDFTVNAVVPDSVVLNWTETGTASNWELVYGLPGYDPDTMTAVPLTDTNYVLTNLQGGVAYEAYVRADCGGSYSYWRGPVSFVPGQFIMGTSGLASISMCGGVIYDDGGANGQYSNNVDYKLTVYPSSTDSMLTFHGTAYTEGSIDYLKIYEGVGTDGNLLWATSSSSVLDQIPLDTCVSGPITLHFHTDVSVIYAGIEVYINCVAAPECSPVENIAVHPTPTSALVTWQPGFYGTYSGAIVEYKADTADSWNTLPSVTGTYTVISGLDPLTAYNVRISTDCEGYTGATATANFSSTDFPCEVFDTTGSGMPYQVGTGTGTSYYLPIGNYFNYSYTQQLYLASELNGAMSINGIDFQYAYSSSNTAKNNVTIYLANVSASSLSSGFVPYNASTFVPVYTGSLACTNGWNHFDFTTPFQYDGTSNLLLVVHDNSGDYDGTSYIFSTTPCTSGLGRYVQNDGSAYSINTVSGGTSLAYRANVKFNTFPCLQSGSCAAPAVAVTDVTTTTVTVAWAPGSTETSWELSYRLNGAATWSTPVTVTGSSYTVTGLSSGMPYEFKVGHTCSGETFAASTNATTLCATITLPYTEDFNNWGTGSLPNCWYNTGAYSTSNYSIISGSQNMTGTTGGSVYMYSSNGSSYISRIILPELDSAYQMNQAQLVFNVKYTSSSYVPSLTVGVMSDPNDLSTFVPVDTITSTNGFNQWEVFEVALDSYTGNGAYAAIQTEYLTSYFYCYIDNLTLEAIPTCPRPDSLTASNSTTSSVDLSWNERGSASSWIIEYGPRGFQLGTGTVVTANSNPFTLAGLPAAYQGEYYVKSVCSTTDTGDYSRHACPFETTQIPATLPYNYDFENVAEWNNWQTCSNHETNNWYRGNSVADSGSYAMYIATGDTASYFNYAFNAVVNAAAYRDIDFGPVDSSYTLSFRARVGGTTTAAYDGLMVFLVDPALATVASSSNITSPWGNVNDLYRIATVRLDTTWQTYEASFDTIHGVHRVAFFWFNQNTGASYTNIPQPAAVDNIHIKYSSCPRPVNLQATVNTGNASLTWEGDPNANYEIVYRNTDSTSNQITYSNTNSIVLSGLDWPSQYVFWVRKLCGVGDTSLYSDGKVFNTTCPSIDVFPYVEDFETNTFECWAQEGDSEWEVGTGDYSTSTGSHSGSHNALITHSSTGDVTKLISPVLNLSGAPNATLTYWYVMREWGSDLDELRVYYRTSQTDTWHLLKADTTEAATWTFDSIALPSTSATYQIAFEYTDNYGYGVGIDSIVIDGASSVCPTPMVTVTNVNETDITITIIGDAAEYEVAYVTGANWTNPASGTSVTTPTYTINGLMPGTLYTVGVRAVCDNGQYSEWVTLPVTTVDHPCMTPSTPVVSAPTFDGATVSWQPGENETAWDVHIFCVSPVFDSTFSATTNSVEVHGLDNGVTYSVAVRAMCLANWYSEWSDTVDLTTATCPQVSGVTASSLAATTATITWTSTGAANYEVEYGNKGFQQGAGTIRTTATNSIELTGLEAESSYDVFVRSLCSEDVASLWSNKYTFTTPENDGIADVENGNVTLYPNPASTSVTLRGLEGECTVTVVDLNGREVYKTNANNTLTIDLSGYAKGAYFVRITGESTTAIRKLIVK